MDKIDQIFILGLLAMLIISIIAVAISPYLISVYGETEKQCVKFSGSELIKLESIDRHGCDWLANKILGNSTFNYADYEVKFWDYTTDSWDIWVLTK